MKWKKFNWQKLFIYFVFLSFILTVIFSVIAIIDNSLIVKINKSYANENNNYILILIQCILGIFLMMVPKFLEYKFKFKMSPSMSILFVVFLYCAIYLGEAKSFYYTVPHWDTLLHAFSGFILGAIGFSFITILNKTESVPINLSPLFVVIFSFCFAVTLGVFWEIYEFTMDGLLSLNMQKFALENGYNLTGRNALADTMKDLMVDCLGAGSMSIIGYISLKYNKGWIEKLLLKESS